MSRDHHTLDQTAERTGTIDTTAQPAHFMQSGAGTAPPDPAPDGRDQAHRPHPSRRAAAVAASLRRPAQGAPGDPRWARPALWAVLALAAVLYTWSLTANWTANAYYSAAVQAGAQSWKAFFFGALDAGSFITVDKPPMALWVMALSARIFGFSAWSVLLPQAIAGVAAIAVLYATVRRAFTGELGIGGAHAAALVSALVLALTPITVAINRDNNPDTLLVLLLVLAAWALQRAIEGGRLRPLLVSALMVGLAFNTKMLQAYVVLPAFALVYLACGPGAGALRGTLHRLGRLALAGVVLAVSSFWWMVVVDLWPARSRPYIGGSTDNTVWDLVIGYNGLGRIFGRGAGPGSVGSGRPGPGGGGGGGGFGGEPGAGRMFNDIIGGQISWLIPLAVIGLAAGLILLWRRPRTDPARASLLLWGGWLGVHLLVFSFAQGTFHPYYSTVLAPAIGALSGAGGTLMISAHRRSARWAWLPPIAVVVTAAWAFTLLRRTPQWSPWLPWAVAGAATAAVACLVGGRLIGRLSGLGGGDDRGDDRAGEPAADSAGRAGHPGRAGRAAGLMAGGVVLALVAVLAGPAAYAVSAAGSRTNGTNPLAGPSTGSGFGGPGRFTGAPGGRPPGAGSDGMRAGGGAFPGFPAGGPGALPGGAPAGAFPPGDATAPVPGAARAQSGEGGVPDGGPPGGMGGTDTRLISYLTANRGSARWLVAVGSAMTAAPIMLQTGSPVIAMGGFTGSDPAMTAAKLSGHVGSGALRFILLGGGGPGGGGPGGPGGGGDAQISTWVQRNCTLVPATAYSAGTGSAAAGQTGAGSGSDSGQGSVQRLYRCG